MTMVGIGATVGAMLLGGQLDSGLLVVGAPLVGGAAVYSTGQLLGYDGSFALGMLGAGAGAALGGALFVVGYGTAHNGSDVGVLVAGLGLVSYAVLPPIGATVGYAATASPTVLTAPGGEVVPGVALRVGL